MGIREKLISNTFYFFADFVAGTLMGLIFWYIAAKSLIPDDLGKLSTSLNLAYVVSSISLLGMNYTVWKLIPEYKALKKEKKVISLVRFSSEMILISNILILLIFVSFPTYLSSVLKIDISTVVMTGIIIFALSFSWFLGFIMWGLQDIRKLFLSDLLGQIPRILISALLVLFNIKVFGLLIGFLVGMTVTIIPRLFIIPFRGESINIDKKKVFFKYGIPATISTGASVFFLNGQYVLLTILKNTNITGLFTIAMTLTSFLYLIPNVLTSALLPISSQLSVDKKNKENLATSIALIFRYSLFLSLPIIIFFVSFPGQIILTFSRSEDLPASELFPLLSFSSIIYGLGSNFLQNLYAIGKPKINRDIFIVTSLILLLLSIPLVAIFSAQGLALSYLISSSFLFVSSFYFIKKFLNVKIPVKNISKLIPAILLAFSFIYWTTSFFSGLLFDIVISIITLIIYLIILIPFRFYTQEDLKVMEFFSTKSPILRKEIKDIYEFLRRFVK